MSAEQASNIVLDRMSVMAKGLDDPFALYENIDYMIHNPKQGSNHEELKLVLSGHQRLRAALASFASEYSAEMGCNGDGGIWQDKNWAELFDGLDLETKEGAATALRCQKIPVDALLKLATQAPFGKGSETVIDTNIRNALEIPASDLPEGLFGPTGRIFQNLSREYLEAKMKPLDAVWEYKLYKMHLYGVGGKFEQHVDTLHADNHVATLIIQLPSKYEGGGLTVKHHDEKIVYEMSRVCSRLYACAFFTDCPHSVAEVTSGHRIVLQYDIYEKVAGEEDNLHPGQDESLSFMIQYFHHAPAVERGFRQSSEGPDILLKEVHSFFDNHAGNRLGFLLFHRYSIGALDTNILKGLDSKIYKILCSDSTLKVSLRSLILSSESDLEGYHESLDANVVTVDDCIGFKRATSHSLESYKPIILVHDKKSYRKTLLKRYYAERTGDVSQEAYFAYFAACFIINRAK